MINFIKTLINLYKVINFTKEGNLVISYNKSTIIFTKRGDLVINAGRHTIHNRDLFFDGCDKEFIEQATKESKKSKAHLERFVMSNNRASEFTCNSNKKKKGVASNDGN